VFLDRDGVLNKAVIRKGLPYPPDSLETLVILPGVPEALSVLRNSGFRLIVVTNQPDVGAGRQSREAVERIHTWMRTNLSLDDIRVCFHTDADKCMCRKPRPGMLLDAATSWSLDLAASIMIGDRWRDIEAGHAAGCRTIYLRSHYDERQPSEYEAIADSLLEASQIILAWRV
jgi:D-glycero-D-manno-heptose 1,7-bisphosphate phosphatase